MSLENKNIIYHRNLLILPKSFVILKEATMEQFFETELCVKCKGKGWCGKPCRIYSKIKGFIPKKTKHFSGSSPP
jgi:hypothetical protein